MTMQRVTLRMTELRCLSQSESDGSEPYLWTTFFASAPSNCPFRRARSVRSRRPTTRSGRSFPII
jgi:hypothetical protein